MKNNSKILNKILPFLTIGAIFLLWEAASIIIGSEYILPTVEQTFKSFLELFGKKEFYIALEFTLLRSLIAFLISFVIGFLFAFLRSRLPILSKIVEPLMAILRSLPTIAVILLLLFWTNSKIAPIVVTTLVVLPTSYTHLTTAFESVEIGSIEAAKVDGANGKQIFAFIEFPQIAPHFYKSIGSGISLNFKLMVAAEVLAQTAKSIGQMLNSSKVYFEIAEMTALVVVSVAIGVIIEFIFNKISEKSSEWK